MNFSFQKKLHFKLVWHFLKPHVKKRLPPQSLAKWRAMKKEAQADTRRIFESWPENGGRENLMGKNVTSSIPFIGIYRATNLDPETFRQALHAAVNGPLFTRLTTSRKFDLARYGEKLRAGARWSQAHRDKFPRTFVYHMVHLPEEGDPQAVGWTFTRCEICELFTREGVAEIIPAFCALDHVFLARRDHTILSRNYTIAQGDGLCDFFICKDPAALAYKKDEKKRREEA